MSMTRHINVSVTPSATAGQTIGDPIGGLQEASGVTIAATVTGNTGGALDIYIQREVSSGVWYDWIHFTQIASGAAAASFAVDTAKASETVVTTVGTGTAGAATPALAAGDIANPLPSGRIRFVTVSGAGSSASSAQLFYFTLRYD